MKTRIRIEAERAVAIERMIRRMKPTIRWDAYHASTHSIPAFVCVDGSWAKGYGFTFRDAFESWRADARFQISLTFDRKYQADMALAAAVSTVYT